MINYNELLSFIKNNATNGEMNIDKLYEKIKERNRNSEDKWNERNMRSCLKFLHRMGMIELLENFSIRVKKFDQT